jgi:LysM repeat protein
MKSTVTELLLGIGTAIVSILLVTGAMMMSLGEILPAPVASVPTLAPPPETQNTRISTATSTPTINPSLASHSNCPAPKGWQTYVIKAGDTVEKLAAEFAVTADQIIRFNCLDGPILLADKELVLPPLPTPTGTPILVEATAVETATPAPTETVEEASTATSSVCERPGGWIPYRVRAGDTLSSIGMMYNTSYLIILDGNCLPRNHRLIAGETLYVPNNHTSTPRVTKTNTPEPEQPTEVPATNTPVPSQTPLPPTATDTPVIIPTETFTSEPPPTETNTPVPPPDTPTPTPTDLSLPTVP